MAGNKSALNNGLIYFQKIWSLDFFHHFSLENSDKYWPIDTVLVKLNFDRDIFYNLVFCVLTFCEHVLFQISIFVYKRVTRVLN